MAEPSRASSLTGRRTALAVVLPLLCSIAAAPPAAPRARAVDPNGGAGPAKQVVTVWFNAGLGRALQAMEQSIREFHAAQDDYIAQLTIVPEATYTHAIRVAGQAGDLPCLLRIDGPLVPHFAWLGYLRPLDGLVPKALAADFLPSVIAQGTYRNRLYALGPYESGLAIFGNRRHLRAAGVRLPTADRPWTLAEFEQALAALAATPGVAYALDLKVHYGRGEFYTYAFAPIVQSMGGDLIDRRTHGTARGVLDGPASVAAMTRFQSWFRRGWASARGTSDNDFATGKVGLSWVGHWAYPGYAEALGADLVLLPMPDFGHGARTGAGAWTYAIPSACQVPRGAWALLRFMLQRDNILRWSRMYGGVPARRSALLRSPLHTRGGALHVYLQQAERGWTVPRPSTPAYPTITLAFSTAVDNIIKGGDPQKELTAAAARIDEDIQAHDGYR